MKENTSSKRLSVIIPVYNALDDVKLCLESILKNFNFELGEVYLINDCSGKETTQYLEDFALKETSIKVLKNEENLGFIKTCNKGMQLAKRDIVVLLNSDTKIPAEFCERIIKCFDSDDKIGIASPISSHTCSYYIPLPKHYTIEKMNRLIREKHECRYPLIAAAEGFCFCIRKDVIEQQGFLDEIYGKGYHEEVDFAYRAITNGWKNVLIDDLYVYHKRQASFGAETRLKLIEQNNPVFLERWNGFREQYVLKHNLSNPVLEIEREIFPNKRIKDCDRTPLEFLFSIRNTKDKRHKVITLAGVKLKIKRKYKKVFSFDYANVPNVFVNKNIQKTIHIFIPAINKSALTAGPLGILYFGKHLIEQGYNVSFYAMNGHFEPEVLREVKNLDILLDKANIINWTQANRNITVNPNDICVATLWNTAYIAKYIHSFLNCQKFIYIIQDYETIFFANSSEAAMIENTYTFDYFPIFSTNILKEYFYSNNIGNINDRISEYATFDTAANSYLPDYETFKTRSEKKKFVFYGRPHRLRNCYELGLKVIQTAIISKILSPDEWEFYSVGAKENVIKLSKNVSIQALPYMNVEEYKQFVSSFDLGLSLMMSPHPSMVPIDLALSGVPVVTNTYKNKTVNYLKSISENIYPTELNIESLVEKIKETLSETEDLEKRYNNAKSSNYINDWNLAFQDNMIPLIKFIKESIEERISV